MAGKSAAFDGAEVKVFTMVYAVDGEKVLVLRRSDEKKFLPGRVMAVGGKVEPGEDVFESARREFEEETGLRAGKLQFRGTYTYVGPGVHNPAGVVYLFTVENWEGIFREKVDDGTLMWLTLEEIMALPNMGEDNKRCLEMVLRSPDMVACIAGWNEGEMLEWADARSFFEARRAA